MDRTAHAELPWETISGDDQLVVLSNISWEQYESLAEARGEAPIPRMAYLDGALELVTTSIKHELDKKLIARLVEAYADESNLELTGIGNATFRKRAKRAGVEPDECYWVGVERLVPELAIEIVYTSGGIDKLEIYGRLGVNEVWFWIEGRFTVYRLVRPREGEAPRYRLRSRSVSLAGIDLDELTRIIGSTTDAMQQTEVVRAYRRSLQRG